MRLPCEAVCGSICVGAVPRRLRFWRRYEGLSFFLTDLRTKEEKKLITRPSPCDPYRHALARRPPRKARPFCFLDYSPDERRRNQTTETPPSFSTTSKTHGDRLFKVLKHRTGLFCCPCRHGRRRWPERDGAVNLGFISAFYLRFMRGRSTGIPRPPPGKARQSRKPAKTS